MNTNTTPAKTYYLTKYALSQKGRIKTFLGHMSDFDETYVQENTSGYVLHRIGRDAHETTEAAIAAAEAARVKKIASLKKQITALEKLAFTVEESK